MKKQTLTLACALMATTLASAQDFNMVSSSDEAIVVRHALTEMSSVTELSEFTTLISGQEHLNFTRSHKITTSELGAPAMPFYTESVVVPGEGKIELEISYSGFTDYLNVNVAPSKGDLKRNVNPSEIGYSFGEAYSTDAFYPGELASITTPFNIRKTRGVTIVVNPYQYNPVTKTLRVYDNLIATVKIDGTQEGINEIEFQPETSKTFHNVLSNFYLNSNSVLGRYTPVEENGDLLIITADAFEDEIGPLVDWKIKEGIKTTVATMTEVGSTDLDIKDYISTFYASNPNLVYVLLVGDHGDVPSHTYGSSGWEQLWSDSYYGQMTGDFYPELFIGRFSGSASDITTQVNRTLEYEKDPAAGDWMSKAIGLASNEGSGIGDDGEADWQHARNIRTKLMAWGYSEVFEFYDGSHGGADASGNPNASMILPEVNAGIGLFNYTGHGDVDVCVTGNFTSTNINSATNNGKYPFVISVACNNGTFTSGTCISEVWMSATNSGSPSGAIAACGSTILMAWAQPMQTQDEMAEIITEAYASNRKATLGGLFYNSQMSMLESYGASSTAKEVMQTWVMFGDPSTLFRNQVTQEMTVTHVSSVAIGTESVHVNCDVEEAMVAITQDGEILGKAEVSGGVANITFDALSSTSPLSVVATKQNYKPYEGSISVISNVGLNEEVSNTLSIYPNPTTDFVIVETNTSGTLEIIAVNGQVIYSTNTTKNKTTINTTEFASGVYMVRFKNATSESFSKLIVR